MLSRPLLNDLQSRAMNKKKRISSARHLLTVFIENSLVVDLRLTLLYSTVATVATVVSVFSQNLFLSFSPSFSISRAQLLST